MVLFPSNAQRPRNAVKRSSVGKTEAKNFLIQNISNQKNAGYCSEENLAQDQCQGRLMDEDLDPTTGCKCNYTIARQNHHRFAFLKYISSRGAVKKVFKNNADGSAGQYSLIERQYESRAQNFYFKLLSEIMQNVPKYLYTKMTILILFSIVKKSRTNCHKLRNIYNHWLVQICCSILMQQLFTFKTNHVSCQKLDNPSENYFY